ncbi:EF-hand domain-containing protein [Sphingomonas oligophenolica]|uniref:EF-hand domain-containing protein n=1 Tax=Sphingomonas oligophenolica TaxID=301154 RepID=A0ABU9Y062_9SPHN
MKKLFFAAALAGTMLGGAAMAGQSAPADQAPGHGGHGRGMMMRADTNGDGMISRAEFMAQADARFARMDKNGDGVITADEMGRMAGRGPGGGLMAADTNHDGKISRAEFAAQAAAHFAKLDANGDGQISGEEMKAMMERMHEGMGGRHGPGGAGGPDGAMMPPPPAGPMGGPGHHGARMLERLDTNHDGRISRDEMRAEMDRHFDKLDANHDGFIDKAEMEAAHDHMKQHMGKRMRDMPGADDAPPPPPPGS